MFRQVCSCGKSYQLKDEMIGRKVKCPACQSVFTAQPQVEEVAQAELVPLVPPQRPGPYPSVPSAEGFLAPLGAPNAPGALPAPATNPLGSPWTAPLSGGYSAGPLSPAAASPRQRIYPWWLWVAAGVAGIAAVGSLLLVVIVFVRMNRPGPGNLASNIPISAPQPDQTIPTSFDIGPFALPGDAVGSDVGNWQAYASDAGGYQIQLPGKPQITSQSEDTAYGPVEEVVVIVGSKSKGLVVRVVHTDMPFDSSKFSLDTLMNVRMGPESGVVIRSTDVQVSGRQGREYLVNYSDGINSKGLHRALAVGGRIYLLGYISLPEQFNEAAARQCLESFTISKEPPSVESTYAPLVAGPGVPLQRQVAWVSQEYKSGGFKIEMPATPTNVTTETTLPSSRHAEGIACEIQGKGAFVVAANRHREPIDAEGLPSFVESVRLARLSQGKLLRESTTTEGQFSVHELAIETANGSRLVVRLYLSSDWLYSVTWFGPSEQEQSDEVKRFFHSFALQTPADTQ